MTPRIKQALDLDIALTRSIWVTGIAVRAVVNIARSPAVFRIHGGLVVLVTAEAGKHGVVGWIGVANAAGTPSPRVSSVIDRELAVGKRRAGPAIHGVAGVAGGRESRRHVVRVGCGGIHLAVAGITIGRRPRIHPRDVTTHAGNAGMPPAEREPGRTVVERRGRPCRRRMAQGAILGEGGGPVVGIHRGVVPAQVAIGARGSHSGILAAGMTVLALQGDMCPSQGESGGGMIVCGPCPTGGGMAQRAVLREPGCDVIGIRGARVPGKVA